MSRRTILLALLASALIATTVPLRDGQPLLRWQDLAQLPQQGVEPIVDRAQSATPALPGAKVTAYRWRDRDGIHISNTAPPAGVQYETLQVDPEAINQIPALESRKGK